ncbi:iron-containing alcohol dehydrogenase [Pseudomonas sp. MPC6]|jgi:alcohol dehydrogenase class IV|uniref:iron-containing alcohol dehydrogenase n=1 Tax=unclassified Pseudomonas TaxID=196821 RepID=UPI00111086E4|nr:iron-containing alcohol dehydrogenase [Pseudomonas sp. MPC6]QCY12413.1 iron-containing alcohol dehydrogenase [Pseudomonas sp. MPC6]
MLKMVFQTTPSTIIELGAATRLATQVRGMGCASVLVVTDAGVIAARLLDAVVAGLESDGIAVTVFSQVQADPPESVILAAVDAAKACGADCVLGLGGGSSLDAAKLAALLARSGESLVEIYGINKTKGPRLPLILVPTTAGTGSEVTSVSVVTTGDGQKNVVYSPMLLPDVAVLDAELTLGLPAHVTAATGIDAMVHAVEAYTTKNLKNPISDCLAREALSLLAGSLFQACKDGKNLEARENMLLGASLAGMAFANAPVAAVHALAYPLGARFHIPHGLSNALVLGPVMRFNLEAVAPLYAQLADIVLPGTLGSDREKASALADYLGGLAGELGLATRLRDLGIVESDIEALAVDAMKQQRLLGNNPREVCLDDVRSIYMEIL